MRNKVAFIAYVSFFAIVYGVVFFLPKRGMVAPVDAGVPAPVAPVHHDDPLPVDDPALARASDAGAAQ